MPSYTVRTTSPAGFNLPYYNTIGSGGMNTSIQGNTAVSGADVLNNCVGYSQGRMLEMYAELNSLTPPFSNLFSMFNVDAENWLTVAINNGFMTGSAPQEGAVGVYYASGQNIGHVCNIEKWDSVNNRWDITEGHYYYPTPPGNGSWDYSYLQSNNIPAFIGSDPDWQLLGFIYPFGYTPTPGAPGGNSVIANRSRKNKIKRSLTILL